jgi:hypothetical protein
MSLVCKSKVIFVRSAILSMISGEVVMDRRFPVMPGNYQNHAPSSTLNPQALHVTSTGDMRIKSNWILCFPWGVLTLTIQFKKCVEEARSSVRAFFFFPKGMVGFRPTACQFPNDLRGRKMNSVPCPTGHQNGHQKD